MKPIIIVPPEMISPEDIKTLCDNGLCVVVAKNPAAVKFIDPIPAQSSRTEIENAAIKLSRKLLNGGLNGQCRDSIASLYVNLLIEGTPLDEYGTQEEKEQRIFDYEKGEELRRLAREEAKKERAAAKAKRLAPSPKNDAK